MAPETPLYFRAKNWEKHQDRGVRNPHWLKLSLGFFDDPAIHSLTGVQQLAFIAVLILCGKRCNRVPFDATYIKKRCSLRVTPDLDSFMALGLIEPILSDAAVLSPLEEKRGEERRRETEQAAAVAAEDLKAEPPKRGPSEAVVRVFDHWRQVMQHPDGKLTAKRRRYIEQRLTEGYDADQLLRAIDGCRASAFHQGDNDRNRVYDDLTLICRDGEHVEQFLRPQRAPTSLALVATGTDGAPNRAQRLRSETDDWIRAGLRPEKGGTA